MLTLLMGIHLHLLQEKGRVRTPLEVIEAVPSSVGSVRDHNVSALQLHDLRLIESMDGDLDPPIPDLPLAFEPLLIILPGDLPPLGHPHVVRLVRPSVQLRELAWQDAEPPPDHRPQFGYPQGQPLLFLLPLLGCHLPGHLRLSSGFGPILPPVLAPLLLLLLGAGFPLGFDPQAGPHLLAFPYEVGIGGLVGLNVPADVWVFLFHR